MCPDCVFTYSTSSLWTIWNTNSQTPTNLTSSDYEENYEDVMSASGKNFFLGLKLNGSNQIEKAYACGIYNNETPYCIEGYYDDSKYAANQEIIRNKYLCSSSCITESYFEAETGDEVNYTYYTSPTAWLTNVFAASHRGVHAETIGVGQCFVHSNGEVGCND